MAIRLISSEKQDPYNHKQKASFIEIAWLIVSYAFVVTIAVIVLTEIFK